MDSDFFAGYVPREFIACRGGGHGDDVISVFRGDDEFFARIDFVDAINAGEGGYRVAIVIVVS